MHVGTILVPDDKPAYEWVRGRALQKMSPTRRHAVLQGSFYRILDDWAHERGSVGTEWQFYVAPRGEEPRPLVPDVAYIAADRLSALSEEFREYPPLAPDIVVEILSPGDRAIDVDHKREVYLSAGTSLVLIVDPIRRTMRAFTLGAPPRDCNMTDTYQSDDFPSLTIDLATIFAKLDTP